MSARAYPDYVLVSWNELPAEFTNYRLIAVDTGYDDDNRLNKALYLYRRIQTGWLRRKREKSFLHGTAKEIGMKHFPCRNLGNTLEERNNHGYQSIGTAASHVYGARI